MVIYLVRIYYSEFIKSELFSQKDQAEQLTFFPQFTSAAILSGTDMGGVREKQRNRLFLVALADLKLYRLPLTPGAVSRM